MAAPTPADKQATKDALTKASAQIQQTIKRLDSTTDSHEVAEIKGVASTLKALFDVNGVC